MDTMLFIVFTSLLQLGCFFLGGRSASGLKDEKDYYLTNKTLRFFPLMMTFLATQVGGGLVLGTAEEAYIFGPAVLLYPLGAALGLIVLGCGLGSRLAQFNVSTTAQIFEVVYRSPSLKKVASLLSIISLFVILVAQVLASNKFIASCGVESTLYFILFWSVIIFYTSIGGMRAVVNTDLVQATFFIAAFFVAFFFVSWNVEAPVWNLVRESAAGEKFASPYGKLTGWLLMPLIFIIIGQDMGQRCFAADAPKTVSKATLCAGICTTLICIVPLYFGLLAKELNLFIPEGSSVLMATVIATTTPAIAALIGAAVIAAIISTADSLINAIASNISQDFSFTLSKKNPILGSQLLSAAISSGAIFCSFYFDNIVDLLIQSYDLSASCLFIPLLFALFRSKGNTTAGVSSAVFGAVAFIVLRFISTPIPRELLSVSISLLGYALGMAYATLAKEQNRSIETA